MLRLKYFLLGCAVTAALGAWFALHRIDAADAQSLILQKTVESLKTDMLGYTSYRTYLSAGKQSLAAQMKFLAATVEREEDATRVTEKSFFGLSSSGMVNVAYTVEYSFG